MLRHDIVSLSCAVSGFCVNNIQAGGNLNGPCFALSWLPAAGGRLSPPSRGNHLNSRSCRTTMAKCVCQAAERRPLQAMETDCYFDSLGGDAAMPRGTFHLVRQCLPHLAGTLSEQGQSRFHHGAFSVPYFARVLITHVLAHCIKINSIRAS